MSVITSHDRNKKDIKKQNMKNQETYDMKHRNS